MMEKSEKIVADDSRDGNGVFSTVRELLFEGQRSRGETLHLRRKSRAMRTGVKRSSIRGRGMEFFESRPYVPNDEVSAIDWKVSARFNGLYTKIFVEERDRPIYFAVDLRSTMFFGSVNCFKSVLATKIAARLATAAISGGDNIGALLFDDDQYYECKTSGGPKSLARFFGLLSERSKQLSFKPKNTIDWSSLFSRIAHRIHPGAALFMISDFAGLNSDARPQLYGIRKKADIFALKIFDPLEKSLPKLGRLGMVFGDDEVVFDSNQRLDKKFRAQVSERDGFLQSMFSALDIPLLAFSTADDLNVTMKKIFLGRW